MSEADKPPVAKIEEGARVPKDAIDPDLIKLRRTKLKVGMITAAGLVFLCVYFLIKLGPDRAFSGSAEPTAVSVDEVLAGHVSADSYVSLTAEPLISHAIRTTQAKGNLGLRVVPARGTGEHLWLVLSGDGWETPTPYAGPLRKLSGDGTAPPAPDAYVGRLRRLSELSFAGAVRDYAAEHPRPMFATAAAIRAGFATNRVVTVAGDAVVLADSDQVAFDVVDPNAAVIIGTFEPSVPTAEAWHKALVASEIAIANETPTPTAVRFEVVMPNAVATVTTKLEAAKLVASRVESVTHHNSTTWGALRGSAPAGFTIGTTTIPDAQLDLVGLYVARAIPSDAYVLMIGDRPDDYWYVLPITIALAVIGLVFAWALIRAVRRDLMPTRAT